jgi:F-type H+-transporting ATPase subunit epsilon
VLSGHAPIVAVVRPGVVTAMAGTAREKFVLYGGLAEFAGEELTILADSATTVEEIDIAEFKTRIEEMQQAVQTMSPGEELDRALALLDHYKSIRITLASTTAF